MEFGPKAIHGFTPNHKIYQNPNYSDFVCLQPYKISREKQITIMEAQLLYSSHDIHTRKAVNISWTHILYPYLVGYTRFVEYQHACIGTIQMTLNAGTIFITFYPNFNMPLNDPSLLTALKAQIQIGGTPQVNTFQATFHYQMAYRVQNHLLDIMVLGQENSRDALLLDIDSNATPTCTYVPKQLSREELIKLLLEKWITTYEKIHQTPVQTTKAPEFVRHQNGLVEVKFFPQDRQGIFPTVNMIQPLEDPRPIQHCIYDVCNCDECLEEAYKVEYDEVLPKKKKGSHNKLKKSFENEDPNVGLIGETSENPQRDLTRIGECLTWSLGGK
ncbi:hypothetical protein R6Q57_013044 [Mikania cordata]